MTEEEQDRIIQGLLALFYARALILEGREALKRMSCESEFVQAFGLLAWAVPACAVITHVFGTGELRDKAFEVLVKMVGDEPVAVGDKG